MMKIWEAKITIKRRLRERWEDFVIEGKTWNKAKLLVRSKELWHTFVVIDQP